MDILEFNELVNREAEALAHFVSTNNAFRAFNTDINREALAAKLGRPKSQIVTMAMREIVVRANGLLQRIREGGVGAKHGR